MRRLVTLTLGLVLVTGTTVGATAQSPSPAVDAPVATGGPVDATSLPDLDAIFNPTEPPIDLVVVQDVAARVEADLPLEGGTLEAVAADGTRFRLVIPDGALTGPTTIGMAPLVSVEGIPFGEPVTYAVQLEPSGLWLLQPGTLTIVPAVPIAPDQLIGYGYEGDGSGMFLARPATGSGTLDIAVDHFSGYGLTKGTLTDLAPIRQRLGGDVDARLSSQVAEAIRSLDRQQGVELGPILGPMLKEYAEKVLVPRMAAAGESCGNAILALQSLQQLRRQLALAGLPPSEHAARLPDLLATKGRICAKEEYEICKDQHIIHRIVPTVLRFEQERQILGISDPETRAIEEDYAERCLVFRLDFESNLTAKDSGSVFQPSVRAKVTLEVQGFLPLVIDGEGPLEMVKLKVKVPRCTAAEHPSDSVFTVKSLSYALESTIWEEGRGRIRDYILTYEPGRTEESVTLTCPNVPTPLDIPLGVWFPGYVLAHKSQWKTQASAGLRTVALAVLQDGGGGLKLVVPEDFQGSMRLTDWPVQEAPVLARQSWSSKALGGKVTDTGSMELFHTPR